MTSKEPEPHCVQLDHNLVLMNSIVVPTPLGPSDRSPYFAEPAISSDYITDFSFLRNGGMCVSSSARTSGFVKLTKDVSKATSYPGIQIEALEASVP